MFDIKKIAVVVVFKYKYKYTVRADTRTYIHCRFMGNIFAHYYRHKLGRIKYITLTFQNCSLCLIKLFADEKFLPRSAQYVVRLLALFVGRPSEKRWKPFTPNKFLHVE